MSINTDIVVTSTQNLKVNLQYYICYASSPLCFSSPNPNPSSGEEIDRLVNIQVTGNSLDESQKNFEVLLISIGLRSMPVVLSDPYPVIELATYTNQLSGEGFIWKFAVEHSVQFYNFTPYGTPGPVGLLIDDLDGVVIPSGVRITTSTGNPSGWKQNIAFYRMEII